MDIIKLKNLTKELCSPYRYNHSINVAKTAKRLAHLHNIDEKEAEIAGIIHDITKDIPIEILKTTYKIDTSKIKNIDEILTYTPEVLHSFTAPLFAKKILKISNENILSAIQKHTLASKDMNILDKIIYISDIIEPNRNLQDIDEIRNFVYNNNIDDAFKEALKYKLNFLLSTNKYIHPSTIKAWNKIVVKDK